MIQTVWKYRDKKKSISAETGSWATELFLSKAPFTRRFSTFFHSNVLKNKFCTIIWYFPQFTFVTLFRTFSVQFPIYVEYRFKVNSASQIVLYHFSWTFKKSFQKINCESIKTTSQTFLKLEDKYFFSMEGETLCTT